MIPASGAITMRDIAARLDASGEKFDSTAINLVAEKNPLLAAMPVKEANDGSSNKTTYKVALPDSAEFTGYGEGVKPSKGGVTHVRNTAAHMDACIEISQREYDEAPDVSAFLRDHADDVTESMTQKMANELLYGSLAKNVRGFNGFFAHQKACGSSIGGTDKQRWTPRGAHAYDDKHPEYYMFDFGGNFTLGTALQNGEAQSLTPEAAGTTAHPELIRSIGLVGLGNRTVCGFYPRGTNAGIKKGKFKEHETLVDENGGKYEGCIQFLSWDFGLDIPDWRYVAWGRNLDLSAIEKRGCEFFVIEYLSKMKSRIGGGNQGGAKFQWVMSLPVWDAIQSVFYRATMGNACSFQDLQGVLMPTLWGTPVAIQDCMNKAEVKLPTAD